MNSNNFDSSDKTILDAFEEEIKNKPVEHLVFARFNDLRAELDAEEKYWPICEEIIKYAYRLALDVRHLRAYEVYEQKYVDSAERNKAQLLKGVALLEIVHARAMRPFLKDGQDAEP